MIYTSYITKKMHWRNEISLSLSRCVDLRQQLCFVENKLALHLSAMHSSIQVVVQYIEPQGRIITHILHFKFIDSFPTTEFHILIICFISYFFHPQDKTKTIFFLNMATCSLNTEYYVAFFYCAWLYSNSIV